MQPIVTLTMNPALDTTTAIDRVVPEHKLRCQAPRHDPGGGGINVCRAIHKLGGTAIAYYPAGGPTGRLLQKLLDQEGVCHRPLEIAGWTRENVTVTEETTRQQFRFIMPGPELSEREWRRCLDELAAVQPRPAYLVASGSLPPGVPEDFYARLAVLARELGSRFVLDSSGTPLRLAVRGGVYLIKPSLRELAELVGRPLPGEPEQEQAARELVHSGESAIVVISLGAEGALLVWSEGSLRLRTPPGVPVQSKVGAGDSLVAGLVLGLAQGRTLPDSFRLGVAAGTASVLNPGTALCSRADTDRFYEQIGRPVA